VEKTMKKEMAALQGCHASIHQMIAAAALAMCFASGCSAAFVRLILYGQHTRQPCCVSVQVKLELSLPDVPALPGAEECIAAGLLSSLHPTNAKAAAAVIDNYQQLQAQALHPLLFDPQTAGGLLAGVHADAAGACVECLRQAGYADACVVGRVLDKLVLPEAGVEEQQLPPLVIVSLG
jgi:selenide,water dikinase